MDTIEHIHLDGSKSKYTIENKRVYKGYTFGEIKMQLGCGWFTDLYVLVDDTWKRIDSNPTKRKTSKRLLDIAIYNYELRTYPPG